MSRVLFEDARPALQVDAGRADVACFVGLVRHLTGVAIPGGVQDWLKSHGWLKASAKRPLDALEDVPIPVENWAGFTSMFDSGESPLNVGTDYLAAAVRSFFAQGGRRCYVVRMDDPVAPGDDALTRKKKLDLLLPGSTFRPDDFRSWHGVGHLAGLLDVSFLSVPDLPILVASTPMAFPPPPDPPSTGPEVFVECAPIAASAAANPSIISPATHNFKLGVADTFTVKTFGSPTPAISITGTLPQGFEFIDHKDGTATLSGITVSATPLKLIFTATNSAGVATQAFTLTVIQNLEAPRLSTDDYDHWADAVEKVLEYLVGGSLENLPSLREVQFVAAFPLPQEAAPGNEKSEILAKDIHDVITTYLNESTTPPVDELKPKRISSPFLQLAYPWLKTSGSHILRESLEPPDGVLVGMLARNALKRGTFVSAANSAPAEVYDLWPALPPAETRVSSTPLTWGDNSQKPFIERISLFGFQPDGLRLLSDVTAYPGESYRPASVNRLVGVICRTARRLGEDIIFRPNGENLWLRVRRFLEQVLTSLWRLDALEGATARDAFSVRCDRGTMTQNDLDSGRLVAEVVFTAAASIELIRVTLALQTSDASSQEVLSLAEVV